MDKVPIFLCCWHILKAWCLCGTKKIKDVEVWGGVFQVLHDVMYMSINHGEIIDDFKDRGKVVDALPSSLIHSNVSLRQKQWKSKKLGHTPWLATLWGGRGACWSSGMATRKNEKHQLLT
jgi:hypothetical protein